MKSNTFAKLGVVWLALLITSCGSSSPVAVAPQPPIKANGASAPPIMHYMHITGAESVIETDREAPGGTAVPLPANGATNLGYHADDRLEWVNDTRGDDFYVCFSATDTNKQPFHAIVWFIPRTDKRESGKIRDGAYMPSDGFEVDYHVYAGPPMCTPPTIGPTSIPKVIIKP